MSGVNAHAILKLPDALHSPLWQSATPGSASTTFLQWRTQDMRTRTGILPRGHPLLFSCRAVAGGDKLNAPLRCEFVLPMHRHPGLSWLYDHRIGSSTLLPGAAYLELAVAAAAALAPTIDTAQSVTTLSGVVFAMPCVLAPAGSDNAHAQILMCDVELESGRTTVRSSTGTISTSSLHMHGSLLMLRKQDSQRSTQNPTVARFTGSLEASRAACPEPTPTSALYVLLAGAGLHYGAAHRLLRGVHAGAAAGQAVAFVGDNCQEHAAAAPFDGYLLHPAVLDCALQLGAAVPEPGTSNGTAVMVPAALQLLIAEPAEIGSTVTEYVTQAKRLPARVAGTTRRDHVLSRDASSRACVLHDLEARSAGPHMRVMSEQYQAQGALQQLQPNLLYQIEWMATTPGLDNSAVSAPAALGAGALSLQPGLCLYPVVPPTVTSITRGMSALLAALQTLTPEVMYPEAMPLMAAAFEAAVPADGPAHAPASAGGIVELSAALKAALRSCSTEAWSLIPRVGNVDGSRPAHGRRQIPALFTGSAATTSMGSAIHDGYGCGITAGVLHKPRLVQSSILTAPEPYQMLPKHKGNVSSLTATPVTIEHVQQGTVLLSVKAVGINFRDVLNVLGMYPGVFCRRHCLGLCTLHLMQTQQLCTLSM
jgi:Polyketide synthase dehydratase